MLGERIAAEVDSAAFKDGTKNAMKMFMWINLKT